MMNIGNFFVDDRVAISNLMNEAITEYREAIRLKPHNAEFHSNLGVALRNKGELDNAIAEFQEAICLKKNYAGWSVQKKRRRIEPKDS